MTKASTRNLFLGITVAVTIVFLGLTYLSHRSFPDRSHPEAITEKVAWGKMVWEKHACIDCHTLLGEGAYYAPELVNVIDRRGEDYVRGVLKSASVQGWGTTRKMPKFDLSEQDIDGLIELFKWTNRVKTEKWPPNIEG